MRLRVAAGVEVVPKGVAVVVVGEEVALPVHQAAEVVLPVPAEALQEDKFSLSFIRIR